MNSFFSFKSSWCNDASYNSNRPVQNTYRQRGKKFIKFFPPNRSEKADDLCLFFCLYPSSMPVKYWWWSLHQKHHHSPDSSFPPRHYCCYIYSTLFTPLGNCADWSRDENPGKGIPSDHQDSLFVVRFEASPVPKKNNRLRPKLQ